MKELLFASQNADKQKEIQILLKELGIKTILPQDIKGCESLDVDETGDTVQENSYLKASQFAQVSGLTALADDSCLEVEALDGAPGVHTKRFFPGTWQDRNQEILRRLKNKKNRSAQFVSSLCLVDPKQSAKPQHFTGVVKGQISLRPSGNEGFEYDYIFIPKGCSQTFAELGTEIKNKISHRAAAIKKLKKYLKTQL